MAKLEDVKGHILSESDAEKISGGSKNEVINICCPKCGKNFKFDLSESSFTCPHCKYSEKVYG